MVRLRDLLLLLVAILLLTAIAGGALLITRMRSQAGPTATLDAQHEAVTSATPPASPVAFRTPGTPGAPTAGPSITAAPTKPTGSAASPGTPAPSTTPTLTPSPTPEPASRLAAAQRARRNGDYASARAELERVPATDGDPGEAIAAEYQAAVLAYLDGDLAAARDRLQAFIDAHPDDHRVPAAHFYRAETLAQLGAYPPALEHYAAYLARQDVLADLVYARVGAIHRFTGDPEAAAAAYAKAIQHAPDLSTAYDMREQRALALQAAGDYSAAQAEFTTIVDASENAHRLARIWYRIGGNQRLMGDEAAARDAFAQAVAGDPRPGYAHRALVELVNAGVEVDEYQRGLIDYHVGSYQAAIEAFQRFLQSTPNPVDDRAADQAGDAHYYTARSWQALGDPGRALQACEHALEQADAGAAAPQATGERWGDLWLLKAELQAELDDASAAIATYQHFAQTYPGHALAPEALWQAALLLERDQRYTESADRYAALADHHPDADRASLARFRAGLWRYWIGDLDGALGAWSELSENDPHSPAGRQGRYWLGRTLWERGLAAEARVKLGELARDHPRTYYGLRAAHLLANDGQIAAWRHAPKTAHLTFSEAEEHQEVLDWLGTWADLSVHEPERAISSALSDRLRFRRAAEMHALGLRDLARHEFDTLRKELEDPLLLYQFALLTRDLEHYAPSLRAAIDLTVRASKESAPNGTLPNDALSNEPLSNGQLAMPRMVQRLAYPAYYADLVLAESASLGLDPLLLFALIWQESIFDAQVASWAGAVGLTQIMPATGQWIAEMTAWPEYDETLLQRAYLNVKFGAWFLDRILDQAAGDVFTALAGYNGGPGLALGWQERAGGDPDLLVEIIPKSETQRYLRAIYRHYDIYHRLYADGPWQPGE